ncbi:MAG: GTPase HflX [Myxococcales bacterium]|nr:GTPase HflX [Myxococcales bacterium]
MHETAKRDSRPRAVLVGVQLPDTDPTSFQASLDELGRLVTTLGYAPDLVVTQKRDSLSPAAVLGEGRLHDLAEATGGSGHTGTTVPRTKDKARVRREGEQGAREDHANEHAHAQHARGHGHDDDAPRGHRQPHEETVSPFALVAIDHDITPSQARNLERATGVQVLDRTGIIVEIFHRHAKSREAKLQVEIARLAYTAPRLRESPTGKERQAGRGAGEAALELDRRKIRDRIAELKEELELVQKDHDNRRALRQSARRVALVGYTNAGKSSLMRALTGSHVLVENKLFATLDTTVRALHPEVKPRVLVSDTVGFIKKLPHDLVASFKSTLDEAHEASLLLHVVDASDATFRAQLEVTREVLAEIGATSVPSRIVLNKTDLLSENAARLLAAEYPDALLVSAHDPAGVAALREHILAFFDERDEERAYLVPYAEQARVAELHEHARVVGEEYGEAGVRVRARGDAETLDRLEKRGLRRAE